MANENKTANKPKKVDPIVKAKLDSLSYEKEQAEERADKFEAENMKLKRQLKASNDMIESGMVAKTKVAIRSKSTYTDADLEGLGIVELQQIEKTLDMRKDQSQDAKYKSIRAGGASEQRGPTTVGSLFGKTRDEILEMGGEH